jgi:hypothetical protein
MVDPADDSLVAAVLLDASARPDVADLARVTALDGVGDLRCGVGVWDVDGPDHLLVRFEVAVDHPVRCWFHLVVPWEPHRHWLAEVVAGGALAVGTGEGDGDWLVLTVDPARLGPVLDLLGDASGRDEGDGGAAP